MGKSQKANLHQCCFPCHISHTSPMDPPAPNAVASGRTKGGKPVQVCGHRRREWALQKRICTQGMTGLLLVVLGLQQLSPFKPLAWRQRCTYASWRNRFWQDNRGGGWVRICAGPRMPTTIGTWQPGREDAHQIGQEAQEDNDGRDGHKKVNVGGLSPAGDVTIIVIGAGAAGIVTRGEYISGDCGGGDNGG
jgi:hypothetical protein